MDPSLFVPVPDPISVPWGWYEFLLMLTFVLHILFMNTMLGVAVITVVQNLRSRMPDLTEDNAGKLPYVIAFTINLGVAPLLFAQVLYGHLLYSSSILMAWYWLSIIGILILLYYSAYIYQLKYKQLGKSRVIFMGFSTALMLVVGFFLTNNMTLMLQPGKWTEYFSRSNGTILNLSDPTLWPRYLHFMSGACAVGGLAIALLWTLKKKRGVPAADEKIQLGMKWFAHGTSISVLVGLWFFFALPKEVIKSMMGGNLLYTIVFGLGFVVGLAALVAGFMKKVMPTLGLTMITLILMAMLRDFVRAAYLNKVFTLSSLKVVPEYSPMILFFASLIVGLVLVALMLKWAAEAGREVAK